MTPKILNTKVLKLGGKWRKTSREHGEARETRVVIDVPEKTKANQP